MKTLLIFTFALLAGLDLSGQINPMDRLFKDKPRDLALYLNPTFEYSQVVLQRTKIAGLGAGIIINKKLSLGIVYNTTLGNLALPETKGPGQFQMKWEGVHLEYTLWPVQKIHLTFPFSAGIGQMKITGNTAGTSTGSPGFVFAEPGMVIEANVWRYAKAGIGTTYRYTANVNYNTLTTDDINGFAAIVSLKFGNFRYSIHH